MSGVEMDLFEARVVEDVLALVARLSAPQDRDCRIAAEMGVVNALVAEMDGPIGDYTDVGFQLDGRLWRVGEANALIAQHDVEQRAARVLRQALSRLEERDAFMKELRRKRDANVEFAAIARRMEDLDDAKHYAIVYGGEILGVGDTVEKAREAALQGTNSDYYRDGDGTIAPTTELLAQQFVAGMLLDWRRLPGGTVCTVAESAAVVVS